MESVIITPIRFDRKRRWKHRLLSPQRRKKNMIQVIIYRPFNEIRDREDITPWTTEMQFSQEWEEVDFVVRNEVTSLEHNLDDCRKKDDTAFRGWDHQLLEIL
ncbi:uncharacterized protein LOC113302956 [Papaver somniferum]|uniref:uncharacterized protein LOC113302956 n=1 Tax=Papaver somniferum TaxID=3469 RepID=UPI000E6FEA1E|nr:uncharacterized protein LOC113302956 [Papaver somniferum]